MCFEIVVRNMLRSCIILLLITLRLVQSVRQLQHPSTTVPSRSSPPSFNALEWYSPWTLNVSHWKAIHRWNISYLRQTFQHRGPVHVGILPRTEARIGITPYSHTVADSISVLNFSDACHQIQQSTPNSSSNIHYIYQLPTVSLLNETQWVAGDVLRQDINFGELETRSKDTTTTSHSFPFRVPHKLERHFDASYIWIGNQGTVSGLHFDTSDNFHVIVKGGKTVVLFPPKDAQWLYPFSDVPIQSQLDPLASNVLGKFPLFNKTSPHVVHVVAGEALYIPRLWWHWVEATDTTVSLNWWHYPPTWWPILYPPSPETLQEMVWTESLDAFRFMHTNPLALTRFYRGSGRAGVCRSWHALAHGFTQRVFTGASDIQHRMNTPTTLVMIGALNAEEQAADLLESIEEEEEVVEEETVEEEIVEEVIETEEVEQQEEWVKTIDPTSGHTYLYNSITDESKWENEEDDGLEDEQKIETSVNPLHVLEEEENEDWKYMYDETYEAGYWLNSKTGESKWAKTVKK